MTELISQKEAARRANISPTTLRKLEDGGFFPKRVAYANSTRISYVGDELEQWVLDRIADRDEANPCPTEQSEVA